MKNIYLIESYNDGLKTVKWHLENFTANFTTFDSLETAFQSGGVPDLIVLLAKRNESDFQADINTLKHNSSFSKIPRIYILPIEISEHLVSSDTYDGQPSFSIPVDKLKFLSTISTFLERAQRRVFRILITIIPTGANIRYSGISLDFSESGMAFECTSDFAKGQEVRINFVNPRKRRRFELKAEIIRRALTRPGENAFYGVKFTQLSGADKNDLLTFITGK